MSRYDYIEEVKKFNPFHDAKGRFASSSGFKTYSANPNTKAGAMAIARSAAAGHGNTMNVHRQSYGENIRQNANWIGHGKQQSSRQQANATLRSRIEPVSGLRGASAAGAAWQSQNQAQGRTTGGVKNPTKAHSKTPANATTATQKPNQQSQNQSQQTQQANPSNNGRTPVTGKDISKRFSYDRSKGTSALDQVADAQGFKNKPHAVKASGFIGYRTINVGTDVVTGKRKTSSQFADDLKNSDTFSHNGSGGQAYGGGIYIAATQNPVQGKGPSRVSSQNAKIHSQAYGSGSSTTIAVTMDPSSQIGDFRKMQSELANMSNSQRQKFGYDIGAYAASKGYDALKVDVGGCDYLMVYNRSKLIVFDR